MSWLSKLFLFIFPHREATNQVAKKSFNELYNELGAFEYNGRGFILHYGDFEKKVEWDNITQLNVYKVDLMTTDRIDMEIVCGGSRFSIHEEIPGWYQFIIKTKEVFPTIPKEWDVDIMFPAFATNYRTIYEKANEKSFRNNRGD
jgi:hypothetical protein